MIPTEPAAADTAGFDGKDYTADWRVFKKSFIQATVDSRGKVSIKNAADQSVFSFRLQGMERDFWKTAAVENATAVLDESAIVPGKTGNGFRFDRFPIDLGASAKYRFAGPMSIAAWVKPETLDGFIVENGYTKNPNFLGEDHLYSLDIRPDGSLWFELTDIAGKRHIHNPREIKLTTNAWQHVAATYDGAAMRVFIGGREVGAGLEDKDVRIRDQFAEGRPLRLGTDSRAAMDDFRLYGRGLNAAEVKALAEGAAPAPADGDLSRGLAAHWDFDAKQGAFWNLNCKESFTVKGVTLGGTEVAIAMTLSVSGDTIHCRYEASAPIALAGSFPNAPEANWFRSKDREGRDIQGELWGTYSDLELFEFTEYTHLERRGRLAYGVGNPLIMQPCRTAWEPATFALGSVQQGNGHVIDFTFQSLDPALAPLAPESAPVVTRPFDRKKLMLIEPPTPVKVEAIGKDAPVFKRSEKLAFRLTLGEGARKTLAGQAPEIRCVDAMTEATVETVAPAIASNGVCEVVLKEVAQGPYRVELWNGGQKLGDGEFVVVGPIEQRKIGPLEKQPFRLREVDRIECADDNGKHEFYALSPQHVKTGEAPGVGRFLAYEAIPDRQTEELGHEWMAFRVDNLAVDKPHLLTIEYPDIDDMLVCVSIMHPFSGKARADSDGKRKVSLQDVLDYAKARNLGPQANYLCTATSGFIAGNGAPLSGKTQSYSTVFYPGDDFAIIQFDNYSYLNSGSIRLSRVVVSEIEDDLPMVDAPNLSNDRIFGHYDEWQRDPTRNFAAVAVVKGEMVAQGVPAGNHNNKCYKWNYVTAERMVKYLRFRGENTWFCGVGRYGNAQYPSTATQGHRPDTLPVFARMFEENGLTLVPSVVALPTFPVRLLDRYTSYDAAQGADSALQINWYGGYSYILWGKGRAPNPLHPAVRQVFGEQAAEVARVYKDYPAVKGVMYINSLNMGYMYPSYFGPVFHTQPRPEHNYDDSSMLFTYDDRTIAEFEKRTGIRVPGSGEKRFRERRHWLLANHKETWADFRCQIIDEAFSALAGPMKVECPRMEFYASEIGYNAGVAYLTSTNNWTMLDILRKMGSHLAVTNGGDYVPGYYFGEANGGTMRINGIRLKADQFARFNAMNTDKSTDFILEGNDRVGAYLGRNFYEFFSRPYPPERPWYTSKVWSCRYALTGNRGSMRDFAVILSRCTPLYISHVWVDGCVPQGYDEQYRESAAAYRTLPLGKYRTVFSEGRPGVTVRSATVGRKT
ncbi:MAG: LamG domain-containing protein [Kiritimatiellae bacterium]|nr:LamG domain-containing protein [Kiritimatiellia bacterium]